MDLNKIYFGDCLGLMSFIPFVADKSIDLILCDLPYGTTACKWDVIIPFEPLWEQYKRIIKDNGAIVLTASQPFTSALVMSNIKMFKYEWIWDKMRGYGHLNSKIMPMVQTENILVFGKSINYYPQNLIAGKFKNDRPAKHRQETSDIYGKEKGIGVSKNSNYPTNLLSFAKDGYGKNNFHPTQKPVALFEYLIKTYTNEGETVLDNCAGSGTTAIACINTNRNYICMEKDKKYFDVMEKRIENHLAQQKLF